MRMRLTFHACECGGVTAAQKGSTMHAMRRRWSDARERLAGHVWTVLPHVRHRLRPLSAPTDAPWSTAVHEAQGPVRLTGALRIGRDPGTLAVLVHGLGGSMDSRYCVEMAHAVAAAGWGCLRLNLRGADRLGADIYHAALASDLADVLRCPTLARFRRIVVIGFSLGGHLALWHGLDPDPRVASVCAIGSPLDLDAGARSIDRRRSAVYRLHVLAELKAAYRQVARRRWVPTATAVVDRITTIRDWDRWTVVPRFGFADVEDYYARASVGPRLPELKVPALYVGATWDPMVTRPTVEDALRRAGDSIEVRWIRDGGHVGFANPRFFEWVVGRVAAG